MANSSVLLLELHPHSPSIASNPCRSHTFIRGSFKELFVAYMRVGLFVSQGDHWIDPHRSPRGDVTCYDRYKKQHN
jgi:hypothetical protein